MKILHITPTFQHPKVRGSLRHYHFLRLLGPRHRITWLTLERFPVPQEALDEMASYTERLYTFPVARGGHNGTGPRFPGLPRRVAQRLALREAVSQMKRRFHQLLAEEEFDLVLFHGKDCYSVIDGWRGLPLVVDFCDATSLRVRTQMRYVAPKRLPLLALRYLEVRRIERGMVASTPHLAFISHRDREAILGPGSQAAVIPNGIDLAYWRRRSRQPRPNTLIFTGVMNYAPNEDAALVLIDQVLPLLRERVPGLEIVIAGRDPTPALRERAQRHPEVRVTGFVDDLRDAIEGASLFVAPLRYASGMQNKIQEALAMEIPVVTTSIVADGIRVHPDETPPLVVADDPAAIAQAVVALLARPEEQQRLAQEGRAYAERHFDWERSARQLEVLCQAAVGQGVDALDQPVHKL